MFVALRASGNVLRVVIEGHGAVLGQRVACEREVVELYFYHISSQRFSDRSCVASLKN